MAHEALLPLRAASLSCLPSASPVHVCPFTPVVLTVDVFQTSFNFIYITWLKSSASHSPGKLLTTELPSPCPPRRLLNSFIHWHSQALNHQPSCSISRAPRIRACALWEPAPLPLPASSLPSASVAPSRRPEATSQASSPCRMNPGRADILAASALTGALTLTFTKSEKGPDYVSFHPPVQLFRLLS